MKQELSAIAFKSEDGWYVALSQEMPNAHGQGRTAAAALQDLRDCIQELIAYEQAQFKKLTRKIDRHHLINATLQIG
jgi:predicted RNase H-like HicB family nuclease